MVKLVLLLAGWESEVCSSSDPDLEPNPPSREGEENVAGILSRRLGTETATGKQKWIMSRSQEEGELDVEPWRWYFRPHTFPTCNWDYRELHSELLSLSGKLRFKRTCLPSPLHL
ncbi:hypothetical protein KIL84_019437 [Mauremys mutica]|uniref:Uncharacterized protein n=1 Tax=Mauremys mutica TaxID=74926 RepID=A0A9D4BA09_9SAUR|nr:hypothetical protein KIL84_019437 [Mauremys mutica]